MIQLEAAIEAALAAADEVGAQFVDAAPCRGRVAARAIEYDTAGGEHACLRVSGGSGDEDVHLHLDGNRLSVALQMPARIAVGLAAALLRAVGSSQYR